MQITAACPKCDNRYQFDSTLVGQKIRCTNPKCREIFEVQELPAEEAPAPKPARRDRRAPTFDSDSGEHPPVSAATPVEETPREADWTAMPPPPVRRRDQPTHVESAATGEPAASADEVLAFMGVAPGAAPAADDDYTLPADVDGQMVEEVASVEVGGETDYEALYSQYQKRNRRRWILLATAGLFVLGALGVGGFFVFMGMQKGRLEKQLAEEAEQFLKNKQYPNSQRIFEQLLDEYPNSKDTTRYRTLRDYSKAIAAATDPTTESVSRRKDFSQYLISKRGTPDEEILKEFQSEIHHAFVRIAEDELRNAIKLADAQEFEAAKAGQTEAIATQGQIRNYGNVPEDLNKLYATLAEKIQEGERYIAFVKSLDERLSKPITTTQVALLEQESKDKGYNQRPEVFDRLKKARENLLKQIVFKAQEKPAEPLPQGGVTSLLVGPTGDKVPDNPAIVFALARGVFYALAEEKGQILWAARVGIDAATLPPRIPAAGNVPALVILPTPDGLGIMAREVPTGKPRWYQRLPAPVRGQPLLVEGRIIAPLADDLGHVAVIESRDGVLQGMMPLGERIGPGASLQPGTSRVFIPAESQSVYVVDANPPLADGQDTNLLSLLAVLTTNHGPNSLRAEPVIVGGVDEATGQLSGSAYLFLAQSDGFSDMKLRTFELTGGIAANGPPLQAIPGVEVKLPGWSWFPPFCDQEKVVIVTDAGALALLGINQKQNQDPALFGQVVDTPKERTKSGRGQIVHAEEQGFWYIANGEMHFKRVGFHSKEGMKLASGWKEPLKLGSPLHAGQVSADRSTLFVVTQTTEPPAWMATAVNAQTGAIVWQRPLGLTVAGDPIKLGDAVYQLDQGAGIYVADPKQLSLTTGQEWAQAGQVLAAPRQDVVGDPYLIPHADGKMAYAIYATGDGKTLNAIVLVPGQKASDPLKTTLVAPLAGAPVLMDKTLIMALADGGLHRWVIGEKDVKRGPDWRAPRIGDTATAYMTLVGKSEVLVSDGHRGLTLYSWPTDSEHQLKQQLNVQDKIIAAPVPLPAKEGAKPRIAVADDSGRITMLEGEPLSATLKWEMRALRKGNEITAGPFLVMDKDQPRLIAVADRTNVVCINPEDRREAWSFKSRGDGIINAPRAMNGSLVLADVSGRYEAVDKSSGQPLTQPYPPGGPLPAAPAAAPVEFGAHLFAPLTDGTVLLIPNDALLPKS